MSRRLEIELTSRREDGTWTWRAAGARRPKGEVPARLLPDSASVGTVLKAEADDGLDGLEIVAIHAPRPRPNRDDRLELIGSTQEPLVTTKLVSRRGRPRSDDDRHDDGRASRGPDRRRRDKRERRDGRRQPARRGKADSDASGPEDADDGRDRRKPRRDRDDRRSDAADRTDRGPRRGDRRDRPARGRARTGQGEQRSGQSRRDESGRGSRRGSADGPGPKGRDGKPRDSRPPRPRSRTPALKASRKHRQAALKALPAEQQPLAREVLRGGVPGVRKSIERMNAKAAAEKLPQIKSDPLIALAETLAPGLKAAEWHDRADAALAGIAEIDLRDIRSVVAAADRSARTDETRALAESLRSGLAQRLEIDHRKWLDELAATIHEGRTVRALRLSSRPPKAGTPLPPDMAERLANMAAADLNASANQQRWATVVDSVALSPVRTQVVPAGIPEEPTEELLGAIRKLADRVPQVAALFGVTPAPPRRGRRPPPPPAKPSTPEAQKEDPLQAADAEQAAPQEQIAPAEEPGNNADQTAPQEQPDNNAEQTAREEQPEEDPEQTAHQEQTAREETAS